MGPRVTCIADHWAQLQGLFFRGLLVVVELQEGSQEHANRDECGGIILYKLRGWSSGSLREARKVEEKIKHRESPTARS